MTSGRIIAGTARGQRLRMPPGDATRPTAGRTREGLFSTLEALHGIVDARFLDLYAGSGAVGLEAASRGAAEVVLVERDPTAVRTIRANLERLALTAVAVRAEPVSRFLAEPPERGYDVVFLDPPYATAVGPPLQQLLTGGWLHAGAVVVVERATRDPELRWPPGLVALQSRRYGDTTLWYGARS